MSQNVRLLIRLSLLTGIAQIAWQVTNYSKMSDVGSLHLIRGKIIILPVDRDTPEQQRGLLEATPSKNGNRPDQVLFYGFMGNVSPSTSPVSQGLMVFPTDSGWRKERSLVRQ